MGIQDDLRRLEIRNERLHRLRLLELRQARQGVETPPDVVMEILETRAELGLSDLLVSERASEKFAEELGAEGRFLVLIRLLGQLAEKVDETSTRHEERIDIHRQQIETRIETQGRAIEERIDRVEEHQSSVNERQDAARTAGQSRTRLAMFAIAVALVIVAGGVISIIVTLRIHGL